jgi:hypothetical protein
MHALELVEVAGLVGLQGPLLVDGGPVIHPTHLEQFWISAKCRSENWHRALKRFASTSAVPLPPNRAAELRATLEEIFLSEMLTRVWTAVLVAHDRRWSLHTAEPLARSVLDAQLEARHRALAFLLDEHGLGTRQVVALNRVRRRVERWTDLLIGGLWHMGEAAEFAVDSERAADFASDLAWRRSQAGGKQAWKLTLLALRNAFHKGLSPLAANPEANARLTACILGCFQAELFDSTGLFQSLWMLRMTATACDAEGLVSDLLRPSIPPNAGQRHNRV